MAGQVRLVLTLHNHQPIGNFTGVMDEAFHDSYSPFLDILQDYPDLQVVLHTSGSLLEWLVEAHPEYIERVREFVQRGQIEILGGPFYEPILACIPRRDRIGQIEEYTDYLNELFDTNVRGMWVPERVWEQSFAGDVSQAGMEYTILDDYHFRCAGMRNEQLHGYYLTEDEGRLFKVFPGSEHLRYTIPFQDPQETIQHLREIGNQHDNPIVAFGDDGEKFGTWPGTKKHVYEDGWLRRFMEALSAESAWLKVTTLAESVDNVSPLGSCYIPDASYREMTEWALPTEPRAVFTRLTHQNREHDPDFEELKKFARGGFWRNFRVKYPESNEMYVRMMEVSRRVEDISSVEPELRNDTLVGQARQELYRAQCNCSFWHGAFGGLYLPHLRNAVYRHLIAADTLMEQATGKTGQWVQIDAEDFNLDARKEVRIASDRLVAYIAPASGGHLYELDSRGIKANLLATLDRRVEPYHEDIKNAAQHQNEDSGEEVASIHDIVHFKQPDLDKKIAYDNWPRKSLVDHVVPADLTLEDFIRGEGVCSDFEHGVYTTKLRRSNDIVEAVLTRDAVINDQPLAVTKTIAVAADNSAMVEVRYELEDIQSDTDIRFGVEFNFASIPAGAADRYYYGTDGSQLGQVESVLDIPNVSRFGLVDEWQGVDASLEMSDPAQIWTMPIQTVSQSEGGFEMVHQSCAVIPSWIIPAGQRAWSVTIRMLIDTSMAHARMLAQAKTEV